MSSKSSKTSKSRKHGIKRKWKPKDAAFGSSDSDVSDVPDKAPKKRKKRRVLAAHDSMCPSCQEAKTDIVHVQYALASSRLAQLRKQIARRKRLRSLPAQPASVVAVPLPATPAPTAVPPVTQTTVQPVAQTTVEPARYHPEPPCVLGTYPCCGRTVSLFEDNGCRLAVPRM